MGVYVSCDPDLGESGEDWGILGDGDGVVAVGHKGAVSLINLLFLVVTLPDPSTLILYWLYGRHSTTVPVLDHFLFPS